MSLVKVDKKRRTVLPKNVRKRLKLRTKQFLDLEIEESVIRIRKPSRGAIKMSPMFRDMIEKPPKSKIRITSELLERLEEERW